MQRVLDAVTWLAEAREKVTEPLLSAGKPGVGTKRGRICSRDAGKHLAHCQTQESWPIRKFA